MPYSLQILAQLLNLRPAGALPPLYVQVLPSLTAAVLWEQSGASINFRWHKILTFDKQATSPRCRTCSVLFCARAHLML